MAPGTHSRWDGRTALLAALAAVHLAWSLLGVVPGHFSVDEGTYHFMARDLAAGRFPEIWNGYRETPSPELVAATFHVEARRLVAVPPEGFTFLALPFYRLAGYRGLFLLNALAFLATVALTGDLARRLGVGRETAFAAMLVLALATFAWEYSQAAWPHATATLFVVAAVWATVRALGAAGGAAAGWSLAAGLLAGLGPTIRLDAAFAWPAVLLPFVFARPARWREAALAAAGLVPGLALLAAVNHAKFGTWSPFSYGREGGGANTGIAPYLPLLALAAAALAVAWAMTRRPLWERLARRPRALALAAGAVAVAALAVPATAAILARLGDGLLQLVVDLRFRDPGIREPALARLPSGAMIYLGTFKKSLLQSCPWVGALVVPALAAGRGRDRAAVLLLALVPAGFVGAYSYFAWHGGMSFNLRYWVPALPFLAVLGAMAWRRLAGGLGGAARGAALAAAAVTALALTGFLRAARAGLEVAEGVLLDLPLAIAAAAALLALAGELREVVPARAGRPPDGLRAAAAVALAVGLAWGGTIGFVHDAVLARRHRARNLATATRLAPHVAPDSILFTPYPDPYFPLIEVDRLRLAVAGRDGFEDFRRLVDHHLAAGRPVVASLPAPHWRGLAEAGLLRGLALEGLVREPPTFRLRAADPGGAGGAPGGAPGER